MNDITNIIREYTAKLAKNPEKAKELLAEVNEKLAAAGAPQLIPGKNAMTTEEMLQTTIGHVPQQANGYGLMCTGTGTVDKVHVTAGVLDCESCDRNATINMAGKTYYVEGDQRTLTAEKPTETAPAEPWEDNHLARRLDRKGQKNVRVNTRTQVYLVDYDDLGYATTARPYTPADQQ